MIDVALNPTLSSFQPLSHQFSHLLSLSQKLGGNPLPDSIGDRLHQLQASLKELEIELEVERLCAEAIRSQIWDFYPTPASLAQKMLDLAALRPGMKLLEPSAGAGHLCRLLRQNGVEPDCFEISPLLRKALELQNFKVLGGNFLEATPSATFDCVIANPPFSNNGIAKHSFQAWDFLRPGGRLITLSHQFTLKPSAKDTLFWNWLRALNAQCYDCGRAFQQSQRSTDIAVQIIVVDKPCF